MGGKGSGNRTNSNPFNARKADAVDPDANARCIRYTRALGALPDFDRGDPAQVSARIDEYFDMCVEHGMRPLVGNFCVAMGCSKPEMWKMVNGENSGARLGFTEETKYLCKKVLCLIDSNFEQVLMDVKNPVPAIFYSKANLGWRDAPSETVVTHRTERPAIAEGDSAEIAGRYLAAVGVDSEKEAVKAEIVEEEDA